MLHRSGRPCRQSLVSVMALLATVVAIGCGDDATGQPVGSNSAAMGGSMPATGRVGASGGTVQGGTGSGGLPTGGTGGTLSGGGGGVAAGVVAVPQLDPEATRRGALGALLLVDRGATLSVDPGESPWAVPQAVPAAPGAPLPVDPVLSPREVRGGEPAGGTSGASPGGAAGEPAGGAGGEPTGGSGGTSGTGGLPWLHVDGNQVKDASGNTVVLRGVSLINLGTTELWEGGAHEMIDRLTNRNDPQGNSPGWYSTVFRIAVYPSDSADHDSPFTHENGSDDFYNDLLRPIVDYCAEKGAYAIIDWHYIANTGQHRQTTEDFWHYVAPRFAEDSHVLFELYNAPINNGDWTSVRSDMQTWFDIVRSYAPDNLVLVGTPNWCQNIAGTATSPINGTNVVYVAHMYPMHWASTSLRSEIETAAAVHPVFLSEWGFEQGADPVVDGTITSYGNPFRQFVDGLRVSHTVWCASSSWFPSMFDFNYNLLVGEGVMGSFVKDWLYDKRNDDVPGGSP